MAHIAVEEPGAERCPRAEPAPEGNVRLRNYRALGGPLRAYTPAGDVHTSPAKNKLVPRWTAAGELSAPRARLLQLLRHGEHAELLAAIVRAAPRRGLARPLDEDSRRFLQRALLSPSPCMSDGTPEPHCDDRGRTSPEPNLVNGSYLSPYCDGSHCSERTSPDPALEVSLAEELREAEQGVQCEGRLRCGSGGEGGRAERERLGRLALSVEGEESGALTEPPAGADSGTLDSENQTLSAGSTLSADSGIQTAGSGTLGSDSGTLSLDSGPPGTDGGTLPGVLGADSALGAAARRLDALLLESRALQRELAAIHRDLQWEEERTARCSAAARGLAAEWRAVRFLDDVLALLRGHEHAARRARAWPFALGTRTPARNYIV